MAAPPDEHGARIGHFRRRRVHCDLAFDARRAQPRFGPPRDAAPRGHARGDGVLRAVLHDALGDDARAAKPRFKPTAVRAAGGEGEDHALIDVRGRADRRMALRRDQHELLSERMRCLQVLGAIGLGDERRLDLTAQHAIDQRAARAGAELEPHRGIAAEGAREERRQPRRRRALERAELEEAVRRMALQRRLRLAREAQHALGVIEQHSSLGGEHEAAPLAVKELRAEALLELLHARGDVRLHTVQRRRRLGDAALLGNRLEDLQLDEVHDSAKENDRFSIIHFSKRTRQARLSACLAIHFMPPLPGSPRSPSPWASAASPLRRSCRSCRTTPACRSLTAATSPRRTTSATWRAPYGRRARRARRAPSTPRSSRSASLRRPWALRTAWRGGCFCASLLVSRAPGPWCTYRRGHCRGSLAA